MKACTFFGHRDCPDSIQCRLHAVLVDLIKNCSVDTFYVGNQGNFDRIVFAVLRELAQEYTNIKYTVVFAYLPSSASLNFFDNTLLPEGIESIPARYAVSWRNNWMLNRSDYVVSYVTYSWGGAFKYARIAERKGKLVINIANQI